MCDDPTAKLFRFINFKQSLCYSFTFDIVQGLSTQAKEALNDLLSLRRLDERKIYHI